VRYAVPRNAPERNTPVAANEHAARIAGLNTSGLVCGPALAAVHGIEPALGSPLRRSDLPAAAARPLREVLRSNIDEIYAVIS
jgi:hypothetical protein